MHRRPTPPVQLARINAVLQEGIHSPIVTPGSGNADERLFARFRILVWVFEAIKQQFDVSGKSKPSCNGKW